MIQKIARKMHGDEKGFTLIELMVVVLIIGILVAIALPSFLGARKRADRRAAQSDLRNGIAAAKTYFTDNNTYTGFNAAAGAAVEPSLTWADGGNTADSTVRVYDVTGTGAVMLRYSKDGQWFGISDQGGATKYCQNTDILAIDTQTECAGTSWT